MKLREAWIKASVEHKILRINYFSKTKGEITVRDVEPDYIGYSRDGKNYCFWAAFDYLRMDSPRCFLPQNIRAWRVTNKNFNPSRNAHVRRWKELIPKYGSLGLKDIPWPPEKCV